MTSARRIAELSIAYKRNSRRWAARLITGYVAAMVHWTLLCIAAVLAPRGQGLELLFSNPAMLLGNCLGFNDPTDFAILGLASPLGLLVLVASGLFPLGTVASVGTLAANSLLWGVIIVLAYEWWTWRRNIIDSETL